jgi:tRNA threonylcarbamoyladenosine biosynthesis protein TsaB
MHVLALDTTTPGGSAAIVDDTRVLAEWPGDATRSHAELLPAALLQLLQTTGLALADVDRFAVASGPGSFTGLRIGIATMQGLAFVTRRPIVPVSALEALAQVGCHGLPAGVLVAAWMDARRKEVFSALYRTADAPDFSRERLVEVDPPSVASPVATLGRWAALEAPAVFVGDGAAAYAGTISGRGRVVPAPALAAAIGLVGVQYARAGVAVAPGAVQPLYVRRPDAEIARDRHVPDR